MSYFISVYSGIVTVDTLCLPTSFPQLLWHYFLFCAFFEAKLCVKYSDFLVHFYFVTQSWLSGPVRSIAGKDSSLKDLLYIECDMKC